MQRHFVGTSGFGYREWLGKFYPRGLSADELLPYYAERMSAVEINSSFYAMPRAERVLDWAAQAPRLRFGFKAPALITHVKRLRDAGADARRFVEIVSVLGPRLGPIVFQLPPSLKKDAGLLKSFLSELPAGKRYAFEFRNASWFDDETVSLLERKRAALCFNDADVDGCPMRATAGFGVLKLRRVKYKRGELARRLREARRLPWRDVYVFFKHEATASGPKLAAQWLKLL